MASGSRRHRFFRQEAEEDDHDASSVLLRFYDPEVKGTDHSDRTLDEILDWPDRRLEHSHNYIQILFPLPEGSPFNFEAPIITRQVMDAFRSRPGLRARLVESFVRILEFYGFEFIDEKELAKKEEEKKLLEAEQKEKVEEEHAKSEAEENAKIEGEGDAKLEAKMETDVTAQTEEAAQEAETVNPAASLLDNFDYVPAIIVPAKNGLPALALTQDYHAKFRNWAIRMDHNHLRITRILRCLRVLGLQQEAECFYRALKWVYEHPDLEIGDRSMSFWTRAMSRPLSVSPEGDECQWLKKWELEMEKAAAKGGEKA